jgi:hypothetical protein
MGWGFRKSFKFGPMRLNLSKSGIGVSAGVRGHAFQSGRTGRISTSAGAGFPTDRRSGARPTRVARQLSSPRLRR